MVVKRGTNDQEIIPMIKYFYAKGMSLRFIEYMDVGSTNGWQMEEVLPSRELIERVGQVFDIEPLQSKVPGETAKRYGFKNKNGQIDPSLGEIGVISSVTEAFCGECNRARLSTEGKLFLCLFASQGYDFKSLLRSNVSDEQLSSAIANVWGQRQDRYSEIRALQGNLDASNPSNASANPNAKAKRIEMSYIGG
jgi:cyclic pyranopterin phosphate synthase